MDVLFLFIVLCAFTIFCFVMAFKTFNNLTVIAELIDENSKTTNDYYTISLKRNILKVEKGTFKKQPILNQDARTIDFDLKQEYSPEERQTIEKDKSVIARAVVGGVLLGPVGAIVGGMSGIGTKKTDTVIKKETDNYYLVINNAIYKVHRVNKMNAYTMYNRVQKLKSQA